MSQRYPGVDLPEPDLDQPTGPNVIVGDSDAGRRLAPALDTGLEVTSRVARAQAATERRQRTSVLIVVGVVIALVTATIGWRYVSDRMAAATPLAATSAAGTPPSMGGADGAKAKSGSAVVGDAAPTPIFAWYGKVKLHLPVPMAKLTEIGFHQASYAWALAMRTSMKDANLSDVARTRTTGRNRAAQPTGDKLMTGKVIRMWRNRAGRPDTAADVGALAGTTVLSPVSGTVVRIKSYLLYGRYPDYEMHIIPDDTRGIDVVMIHLTGLTVKPGDHVIAGVSPVAHIRKFSDKFHDQLADYTKSPGDHVHIQINDSGYAGYRGLDGAVDPSAASTSTDSSDPSASD